MNCFEVDGFTLGAISHSLALKLDKFPKGSRIAPFKPSPFTETRFQCAWSLKAMLKSNQHVCVCVCVFTYVFPQSAPLVRERGTKKKQAPTAQRLSMCRRPSSRPQTPYSESRVAGARRKGAQRTQLLSDPGEKNGNPFWEDRIFSGAATKKMGK